MDEINTLNEQAVTETAEEKELTPVVEQPLHILVTEADLHGLEISRMSDFMGLYAQRQMTSLVNSSMVEVMQNLPFADVGIINDVVQQAVTIAKGEVSLIPDFDHLKFGVREKLKKGIYTVGESKQVEGNLRAVILDEKGVRINDVTLKKVVNNPGTLETTRSISNQLQMKQINDKLAAIQEIQSYQLDKDRDHSIFMPFFSARDYILHAQNAKTMKDRKNNLEKAADQLTYAKNGIYTEMNTASHHLAKYSKRSFFHRQSTINTLTAHLSDDLQLSTRMCGIQMQVYEYLGRPEDAILELEHYQHVVHGFLTDQVDNTGLTAIELMHDNFPYNKENLDCWYIFSQQFEPVLRNSMSRLTVGQTYIISLEDPKDE